MGRQMVGGGVNRRADRMAGLEEVRVQGLSILGKEFHPLPVLDGELIGRGDFGSCAGGEVARVNQGADRQSGLAGTLAEEVDAAWGRED